MKIIDREEFLKRTYEATSLVAEIIGQTMTTEGLFVSLPNGKTTNDGVTILRSMMFDDTIETDILDKLKMAATQTETKSGDGTSATTVLTNAFIKAIYNKYKKRTAKEIEKQLMEVKEVATKFIEENKIELSTKEEMVQLAKLSTKDDTLGELIGGAFDKAGRFGLVSIKQSSVAKDFVEVIESYTVPVSLIDTALPRYLEKPQVLLVRDKVMAEDDALRRIVTQAFTSGKNTLIVASEVGDQAIKFIAGANQANADTGVSVSMSVFPQSDRKTTNNDLIEDFAAVTNASVVTKQGIINISDKELESMYGSFNSMIAQSNGTVYTISDKESKRLIDRKKQLTKEIESMKDHENKTASNILRSRLQMLNARIVYLNIYGSTMVEFDTKRSRVEDAVISLQHTRSYGFLPGSGSVYTEIARELTDGNIFKDSLSSIFNIVVGISGYDGEDDFEYGQGVNAKTGKFVDNLVDVGIIDSAMVTLNVINNSISIAGDVTKIHFKIEEDDKVKDE